MNSNIAVDARNVGKIYGNASRAVAAIVRRTATAGGIGTGTGARAWVLLLDEPVSALGLKLRKEMQSELKRLQTETGITFIFVTPDQEEALTMSNRIGMMSQGALLQVGTPHEFYEHPVNRFVADFIGETNSLERHIKGAGVCLGTGDLLEVPLDGQL